MRLPREAAAWGMGRQLKMENKRCPGGGKLFVGRESCVVPRGFCFSVLRFDFAQLHS